MLSLLNHGLVKGYVRAVDVQMSGRMSPVCGRYRRVPLVCRHICETLDPQGKTLQNYETAQSSAVPFVSPNQAIKRRPETFPSVSDRRANKRLDSVVMTVERF